VNLRRTELEEHETSNFYVVVMEMSEEENAFVASKKGDTREGIKCQPAIIKLVPIVISYAIFLAGS